MKIIITSLILKKAHKNTKEAKKLDSDIDYRLQLSLEIKQLLQEEKINYNHKMVQLGCYKLINEIAGNEFDISGYDITRIENKLRQETTLLQLYFPRPMKAWELSIYLTKEHYKKIKSLAV